MAGALRRPAVAQPRPRSQAEALSSSPACATSSSRPRPQSTSCSAMSALDAEVRRHRRPESRPHLQHRLRPGRSRRAAGQPDPLRAVLSREARFLPRERRPVQDGHRRHVHVDAGRDRPVLQPPHRPVRDRPADADHRRRAAGRQGRAATTSACSTFRPTAHSAGPATTSWSPLQQRRPQAVAGRRDLHQQGVARRRARTTTARWAPMRTSRSARTCRSTPSSRRPRRRAWTARTWRSSAASPTAIRAWNVWLNYLDVQDNFNAEVGFVQRPGMKTTKAYFSPTPRPGQGGDPACSSRCRCSPTSPISTNRMVTRHAALHDRVPRWTTARSST